MNMTLYMVLYINRLLSKFSFGKHIDFLKTYVTLKLTIYNYLLRNTIRYNAYILEVLIVYSLIWKSI